MPGGKIDIIINPDVSNFDRDLGAGLRGKTSALGTIGRGVGLALAGGAVVAAVGLKKVIDLGNEYTANLNELQAVSGATGVQMAKVGQVAQDLGSDLSLPATSAADAAAAMVELAKGGLSVDQAMTAAKGTLQLAAAAQIDAATAAEIQASALNQYGLAADQAGHVSDVLANTANAAAGSIVDVGGALKYVGPIARSVGVDIDSTATAIGILANNGIKGEQAGTSLRAILASLAAPSKAAKKGMDELGIAAFDQQGKFVGLRAITDQLAAAKGRLTDQEFASAAATAFGNESLSAVNALANSGAAAYDKMATAVGRAGGAADVAAAKTKGLGGAMEGLQSQAETLALGIYSAIAPGLERATRSTAEWLDRNNAAIVRGVQRAVVAGETFGPLLGEAMSRRGDAVEAAANKVVAPLGGAVKTGLNELINVGVGVINDLSDVLSEAADVAEPVANGIRDIVDAASEGGGAIDLFGHGVDLAGNAVSGATAALGPFGDLLGGILSTFADLPGPVQAAVIGLTAYQLIQGRLSNLGPVQALRQFSDEMRVQQALATASGDSLGRAGAAMAAFETSNLRGVAAIRDVRDELRQVQAGAEATGRPIGLVGASVQALGEHVPVIARMRESFAQAADGAGRLGPAMGVAAAAGTGLKAAAGSLVSLLGGPMGLAITGVTIGLSLLAERSAEAGRKAAEQAGRTTELANALAATNGVITESVRIVAAKQAQDAGVIDGAKRYGIALADVTDAILNQGSALDQVRTRLQAVIDANTKLVATGANSVLVARMNDEAESAKALLDQINQLSTGTSDALRRNRELEESIRSGNASMIEGTATGRSLAEAMRGLGQTTGDADSKARALTDALRALNNDQLSTEQAVGRLNEQIGRISSAFSAASTEARNTNSALIETNGGINTTTESGRRLLDTTQSLAEGMANAAVKTYELARAQGDDVPTALAKAHDQAQRARDAYLSSATAAGVSADAATRLADRYGLIPDTLTTLISTPGMSEAQMEVLLLQGRFRAVPDQKTIHVTTLSADARAELTRLGFQVTNLPDGRIQVSALTAAAESAINHTARNRVATISVGVQTGLGAGRTIAATKATGGIVAAAYAHGGIHRLTPMRTGIADIVPPNTWRVLGDRLRDDEAYIPINQAARSVAILRETADRMGFALLRQYAQGGIASGRPTGVPAVPKSGPTQIVNNIYPSSQVSEEQIADLAATKMAWRARL